MLTRHKYMAWMNQNKHPLLQENKEANLFTTRIVKFERLQFLIASGSEKNLRSEVFSDPEAIKICRGSNLTMRLANNFVSLFPCSNGCLF